MDRKIVVPVDFSELTREQVNFALEYARALNARILLVHTLQTAQLGEILGNPETSIAVPLDHALIKQTQESAQTELNKIKKQIEQKGIAVDAHLLTGNPFLEIVQFAEKEQADLIIIASHGRGRLKHFLLGSVAEKVAKKSAVPVLIYKPAK
jgi:nucleotide-binding universal stress UspA family protein